MPDVSKVQNIEEIKIADISKGFYEQEYILEQRTDDYDFFYCLKIETMEQFEWLCKELQKDEKQTIDSYFCHWFCYRGQKNIDWGLDSSLERFCKENGIYMNGYIEAKHLERFRVSAKGKIAEQWLLKKSQVYEDVEELWALGQHFGLKTPLLDWTKNFYVALFFAFEEEFNSNEIMPYRAVFRLNQGLFYNGEMLVPDYHFPFSDPYGRVSAQKGLFIRIKKIFERKNYFLLKDKNSAVKNGVKLYLSDNLRNEILEHLEHIDISVETIYPDLDGVVKKCNACLGDDCKIMK